MNTPRPASVIALRKEALRRAPEISAIVISCVCLNRWGVCFRIVAAPNVTVMWYPGSESWTEAAKSIGGSPRHRGTFDQFLGWIRQKKQEAGVFE